MKIGGRLGRGLRRRGGRDAESVVVELQLKTESIDDAVVPYFASRLWRCDRSATLQLIGTRRKRDGNDRGAGVGANEARRVKTRLPHVSARDRACRNSTSNIALPQLFSHYLLLHTLVS